VAGWQWREIAGCGLGIILIGDKSKIGFFLMGGSVSLAGGVAVVAWQWVSGWQWRGGSGGRLVAVAWGAF
jgi:hypothetical protein